MTRWPLHQITVQSVALKLKRLSIFRTWPGRPMSRLTPTRTRVPLPGCTQLVILRLNLSDIRRLGLVHHLLWDRSLLFARAVAGCGEISSGHLHLDWFMAEQQNGTRSGWGPIGPATGGKSDNNTQTHTQHEMLLTKLTISFHSEINKPAPVSLLQINVLALRSLLKPFHQHPQRQNKITQNSVYIPTGVSYDHFTLNTVKPSNGIGK